MKYTDENLPPIIKIYGTLEESSLDVGSDDTMYMIVALSKKNKYALEKIIEELDQWNGEDVYFELRKMLKKEEE